MAKARRKSPRPEEGVRRKDVVSVPVDARAMRPWTANELKLPLWLRGDVLPEFALTRLRQRFHDERFPPPCPELLSFLDLAQLAGMGRFEAYKAFETDPTSMKPDVFIQNVLFCMRMARDHLLTIAQPTHVHVVSTRLDALIQATKSVIRVLDGVPLDRIICCDPNCERGTGHMFHGPWVEALKDLGDATEDAFRLLPFLGTTATSTADIPAEPVPPGTLGGSISLGARDLASAEPAIPRAAQRVLITMAVFEPRALVTIEEIMAEIPPEKRLSDETVRSSVNALIDLSMAERPKGKRGGARLTLAGRTHAAKIVD